MRATGGDPVVFVAGHLGDAGDARVAAVERRWVVIVRETSHRQVECADAEVRVAAAGTGRVGGGGPMKICWGDDDPLPPYPANPIAVSDRGAVVWLTRGVTEERLMAFPLGAPLSRLDRGPFGAIAGLRAVGRAVTWTNAGTARSADLG